MADAQVLLLATLDTKAGEAEFLSRQLARHGVESRSIDLSLSADGAILGGPEKLKSMETAAARALDAVTASLNGDARVVLGLGGGTGGEVALRVMRALPVTYPKVLVTTLPFDPRLAVADSSIILVPTLVDICGLNATLREVFENTAALAAGLCRTRRRAGACTADPSIGITALGATETAVTALVSELQSRGRESTVFHSNGYGGAALARFAERGALGAIIDLTPHELTRIHLAGSHVPMPNRFSAGAQLPRIVLPGGLNFIGLGEESLLPERYLDRPHYAHSGFFTHVKLVEEEMLVIADALADSLNTNSGPAALIVPMGGFSHQDRAGGLIEDPALRQVFLKRVRDSLDREIGVNVLEAHISEPETTQAIIDTFERFASG
ncbi:MAG: Tm-1-like ATP-binding domain-containing protein [Rhodobacteraceae bacterium]|nr:Tm-1-like ATP-binding domain-containing protein [Paracoccaceae bacterium]